MMNGAIGESDLRPASEREHAERCARLRARIAELGRVAIAYSGGVDSSVLLHAARAALGPGAVAVIADSPSLARRELDHALAFARSIDVEPIVVATAELEDERYRANAGDRCYFCKATLFRAMTAWAREHGFETLAFGEIVDDRLDDRPGARAAREFRVAAPLSESGMTKDDVRRYAREHGLAVADKPASACLASRIPVGTEVTRERLERIDAAEAALAALGLRQLRVRDHGRRARIEVARAELGLARSLDLSRALAPWFDEIELDLYLSPLERRGESKGRLQGEGT